MSRIGLFGQISEINDHLYLSGAGVLRLEKLKQKKITCVINVTNEEPSAYFPGTGSLDVRFNNTKLLQIISKFE
jgi:hypothetical protein